MFFRGEVRLMQLLLNMLGHCLVGLRNRGGSDVRDQMRQGLLAGFGEMDFLSDPQGRTLFAQMGIWIVRRVDKQSSRRKISGFSPAELLVLNEIVLDPDPT
jgi:hypothetical protein